VTAPATIDGRGLSHKNQVSYRNKQYNSSNQFIFYIISAKFTALIPLFLQLLYSSLVEEFILPLNKSSTDFRQIMTNETVAPKIKNNLRVCVVFERSFT